MPREIFEEEEFLALVERAIECRVKRLREMVKLKLRTRRCLYTYKCDTATAERLLGRLKIPIIDV